MRKANERVIDSGIYARLRQIDMNEVDRQTAYNALEAAEAFGDAVFWVKGRISALASLFMKPSLKH